MSDQVSGNGTERFEILELLGEGAHAAVWRAADRSLGREVALKILRESSSGYSDAERQSRETRFHQETQAAARLNHQNIVTLLEAGTIGGKPQIVFELIEGVTLREWFGFVSSKPIELAVVLSQLADALDYAHAQGIVHRDIKPENILVDLSGKPYITDFGLAQIADKRITEADVSVGTVAYLAPEQANSVAIDGRADVFALGVVLFELLTGELPFRATTRAEYLAQLAMQDAPSPRQLNREVHPDLAAICTKCLQRVLGRRYASAKKLQEDLERFTKGQPTVARPRSWAARSYIKVTSSKITLASIAFAILLLASAAGIVFWNDSQQVEEFVKDLSRARDPEEVEDLFAPQIIDSRIQRRVVAKVRAELEQAESLEARIKYLYAIGQLGALTEGEESTLLECSKSGLMDWARLLQPTLKFLGDEKIAALLEKQLGVSATAESDDDLSVQWVALGLLAGNERYAREAARTDEDQRSRFLLQTLMADLDLLPEQWLSILDTDDSSLFACLIVSAADSLHRQSLSGKEIQSGLFEIAERHPTRGTGMAVRYFGSKSNIELPLNNEELDRTHKEIARIPFVHVPAIPAGDVAIPPDDSKYSHSAGFWISAIEIPQTFVVEQFSNDEEMSVAVEGIPWLAPEVAAHRISIPAAMRICNRLSDLDGRDKYYLEINEEHPENSLTSESAVGFRIPTMREWQWAAGTGTKTDYFHGAHVGSTSEISIDFDDYGWFRSSQETSRDSNFRASGLKRPNTWGLFDVYGNVCEIAYDDVVTRFVGCGGYIFYEGRRCSTARNDKIPDSLSFGLRPICSVKKTAEKK